MAVEDVISKLKQGLTRYTIACYFFHKWSRWDEPFVTFESVTRINKNYKSEQGVNRIVGQRRTCLNCGKIQQHAVSRQFIANVTILHNADVVTNPQH